MLAVLVVTWQNGNARQVSVLKYQPDVVEKFHFDIVLPPLSCYQHLLRVICCLFQKVVGKQTSRLVSGASEKAVREINVFTSFRANSKSI